MPIVREREHDSFCLYQLKATPLPQLVLICHGGRGNSKTVAARDLSFYTTEDSGGLIGADVTVSKPRFQRCAAVFKTATRRPRHCLTVPPHHAEKKFE
jgi:hypothetical protein